MLHRWIERGFNACQTLRSMFTSIFNRFPVIQAVSLKVRYFSTFFAHFCLPWVRPWDNRGKCYMDRFEREFNASQMPRSIIPIYFHSFLKYSDISVMATVLVSEWAFFLPLLLSPKYAPGTIAVNVTRFKRGFNACKTPRCIIYPSIFNRFWDIASYWSKIVTFSYPTSV